MARSLAKLWRQRSVIWQPIRAAIDYWYSTLGEGPTVPKWTSTKGRRLSGTAEQNLGGGYSIRSHDTAGAKSGQGLP